MMQKNVHMRAMVSAVIVAALIVLFIKLGYWQLDRARQKHAAYELSQTNAARDPSNFSNIVNEDPQAHLWRRVVVDGQYLPNRDVVLDNQSYQGQPGYLVFTPLNLNTASGDMVLVNRGWLANDGHREIVTVPPAPSGVIHIEARLAKAPAPGLLLARGDSIESLSNGIRRVQRINYRQLEEALKIKLYPGLLLLESDEKNGLVRDWPLPGSDEARHQSYAFQWFAMSAALVLAYGLAIRKWSK